MSIKAIQAMEAQQRVVEEVKGHVTGGRWAEVKKVVLEELKLTKNPWQRIAFGEKLAAVYRPGSNYKQMERMWTTLATEYIGQKDFERATTTYQHLVYFFKEGSHELGLANLKASQGDKRAAGRLYCNMCKTAWDKGNKNLFARCVSGIMSMNASTASATKWLWGSRQYNSEWYSFPGMKPEEEDFMVEKANQLYLQGEIALAYRDTNFFGKREWERHFGVVDSAVRLPSAAMLTLTRPSYYQLGTKRLETVMLVQVPKTVDGAPLSLNSLKIPIHMDPDIEKQYGDLTAAKAHWILMGRVVVGPDQQWTDFDNNLPPMLSCAVGLVTHYKHTGEKLFLGSRVHCKETNLDGDQSVTVGWHPDGGLDIQYSEPSSEDVIRCSFAELQ